MLSVSRGDDLFFQLSGSLNNPPAHDLLTRLAKLEGGGFVSKATGLPSFSFGHAAGDGGVAHPVSTPSAPVSNVVQVALDTFQEKIG